MSEEKAIDVIAEASNIYWDKMKDVPKALKRLSMEDIRHIFDRAVIPAIEVATPLIRPTQSRQPASRTCADFSRSIP